MTAFRQVLIVALFALVACAPVFRNHGYVPPPEDLGQVVVGQTTMDMLDTTIGRPSAQGLLTGSGWYYVGSRWRHFGPTRPQEISREVVAISFAPNGTVTNVEHFGLERGRVVVLSRRVTEGSVTSTSFIGQMMRNLGNVQAGDLLGPRP